MALSKVVLVKGKGVLDQNNAIDQTKLLQMYSKGLELSFDSKNPQEGLQHLFKSSDKVGIKINTIGGKKISTRPEVSHALSNLLVGSGILERNLIIWDRTNREMREAGYRLRTNRNVLKIHGTDSQLPWGGYNPDLISHLNIGSRFSRIQSNLVNSSISLAILKDHGMAGVTAGMKNYFGAIHNPNKYHDTNCDPYVAELFETEPIKKKLIPIMRNQSLAKFGDTLANFLYSLAKTRILGKPVGLRVFDKALAETLRQTGLRSLMPSSSSAGNLGDGIEALIGYVYLHDIMSLEEMTSIIASYFGNVDEKLLEDRSNEREFMTESFIVLIKEIITRLTDK